MFCLCPENLNEAELNNNGLTDMGEENSSLQNSYCLKLLLRFTVNIRSKQMWGENNSIWLDKHHESIKSYVKTTMDKVP